MVVVQLATSPFIGGPEHQMLGLALSLPPSVRLVFALFPDQGKSGAFRRTLEGHGLETFVLGRDTPHLPAMIRELGGRLRALGAGVLSCHGYKADVVGLLAARRVGVPVMAWSHGWTAEDLKVRIYETIDRACLRRMDRVVCVSEKQAVRVRQAGARPERVSVIRNAIRAERFDQIDPAGRRRIVEMFPRPPLRIVGSAGRLSPEKGFGVLVEAAAIVIRSDPEVGFIHFGDGPLREPITRRIAELGLEGRFVLAGFRDDLDQFLPHFDLSVLPSFTEGLPVVVLESYAAGVPVVATAVGGTPEVVSDGIDGYLVPPGDPAALAGRIVAILGLGEERQAMGRRGRDRIRAEFTTDVQAVRFQKVFDDLAKRRPVSAPVDDRDPNPHPASS